MSETPLLERVAIMTLLIVTFAGIVVLGYCAGLAMGQGWGF